MSTQLTDADLARLEELAGKATPLPWAEMNRGAFPMVYGPDGERVCRAVDMAEDSAYIAAACNATPALVAEVRRLRDRVEALEKTKKHLSETARVLAEQVGKGNLGKIQDALDYAHYKASEREAIR